MVDDAKKKNNAHVDRTPPLSRRGRTPSNCQHGTSLRRGDRGLLCSTIARLEDLLCQPCRCGEKSLSPNFVHESTSAVSQARGAKAPLKKPLRIPRRIIFIIPGICIRAKFEPFLTAQRGRTRIVVCVRESTPKSSPNAGRTPQNAKSQSGKTRSRSVVVRGRKQLYSSARRFIEKKRWIT